MPDKKFDYPKNWSSLPQLTKSMISDDIRTLTFVDDIFSKLDERNHPIENNKINDSELENINNQIRDMVDFSLKEIDWKKFVDG